MSGYSAGILSSFDPALLCSDFDRSQHTLTPLSHSDEIEALQVCIAEDRTKKNKKGIVIQHRAWNLGDIFRSEGEHSLGMNGVI